MTLDVTKAIEAKSDQLNADDLVEPRTIKIRDVQIKSGEQPISVFYEGADGRPWKPNKTAARCLAGIWGANASNWIGLSCTIYNDKTVTWAGAAVGGCRVSHMEGIEKPVTLMLTKSRGKKVATVIQPLVVGAKEKTPEQKPEVSPVAAREEARVAAGEGRESFNKWWKDNADLRPLVKDIMDELKQTVEERESLNHAE